MPGDSVQQRNERRAQLEALLRGEEPAYPSQLSPEELAEIGQEHPQSSVDADLDEEQAEVQRHLASNTKKSKKRQDQLWYQNAEIRVKRNLAKYLDNLERLAEGVFHEEEFADKEGKAHVRVYRSLPDRRANEYLIDRAMGKMGEDDGSANQVQIAVVKIDV